MSTDGSTIFYKVLVYSGSEEIDYFDADDFLEIAHRTYEDIARYDNIDIHIVKKQRR